jgi:hypothetical protein
MAYQVPADPAALAAPERPSAGSCPPSLREADRASADARWSSVPSGPRSRSSGRPSTSPAPTSQTDWQSGRPSIFEPQSGSKQRPHDSLGGRAPIDRVCELIAKTPLTADVVAAYDPTKEFIRINDYGWDSTFARSRR